MNHNDTKNFRIPGYSSDWHTDFACPHCNEIYDHTNETWDYVGFDGNDAQEQVFCRKCDKQFVAELSVVCVYRSFVSDPLDKISKRQDKPVFRVIQGGKK